jgi:hypothetical protein
LFPVIKLFIFLVTGGFSLQKQFLAGVYQLLRGFAVYGV